MDMNNQEFALQPGTVLVSPRRTYTIRRVIGIGGFGITYVADMRVDNIVVPEAVCIKEFFPRSLCERDGATHSMSYSNPTRDQVERARKDFLGEARRLASLAGKVKGIVTVNEVFEANNTAYYVMEYLRGRSLGDYIKEHGALTWQQTRTLFEPVIAAVADLHRERVTHLDIKPANIMLVDDAKAPLGVQPVLIDFGLSKHYNEDGSATSTINSQGYSDGYAPIEQYGGIRNFSPASDVYALGATMLHCLSGKRPPAATEDPDFAAMLPGDLPTPARAVLLKALSHGAGKRYADAGALYCALYSGEGAQSTNEATKIVIAPTDKEGDTVVVTSKKKDSDTDAGIRNPLVVTDTKEGEDKPKAGKSRGWLWACLVGVLAAGAMVGFVIISRNGFGNNELAANDSAFYTRSGNTFTINGVSFDMVPVYGGTFMMGATDEQGGDALVDEKPVHQITLSDYYIGKTEVTQALWQAVMGSNPSGHQGDELPVTNVSWDDAQEFITRLNEITGEHFRLPTEAEWEFAARGGTMSQGYKYSGSNNINDVAWYDNNSGNETHPVATKAPNELGIYDMSGNVYEWCQDWRGDYIYTSASQTNPIGPNSGSYRVYRGGSYFYYAMFCRVSHRYSNTPASRIIDLGFRLALSSK